MRNEYDANNQLALALEMGQAWAKPVRHPRPVVSRPWWDFLCFWR